MKDETYGGSSVSCPSCGIRNIDTRNFCFKCGKNLKKIEKQSPEVSSHEKSEEEVYECTYCGKNVTGDVPACPHCGHKFKQLFSNTQPVRHFVLLSIVTSSAYQLYWFYRNWKQLKLHKDLKISPFWRAAGIFVPVLGLVLIHRQLRDIRNFSKQVGIDKLYSPGLIFSGWCVFCALFYNLPDPFWLLLGGFSVLPLVTVQRVLNSYWKKEQPGLPEKTKFSGREIVLLTICGIIWILILTGTFIPE